MHSLVSFVINSFLLGVGLAMDAFSVSMANGLNAPKMSRSMRIMIPLTFAVFQFLMPVIGWFCVRSVAERHLSLSSVLSRGLRWCCSCSSAERCCSKESAAVIRSIRILT